MAFLRL